MRWVFEICLFEPNGELQIFGSPFLAYCALVFPTDGTEQERLPTFYAGPGSHAF